MQGQIEIVAAEEDQLSEASEKLRALFTLDVSKGTSSGTKLAREGVHKYTHTVHS